MPEHTYIHTYIHHFLYKQIKERDLRERLPNQCAAATRWLLIRLSTAGTVCATCFHNKNYFSQRLYLRISYYSENKHLHKQNQPITFIMETRCFYWKQMNFLMLFIKNWTILKWILERSDACLYELS
jgi:hypothetical protein